MNHTLINRLLPGDTCPPMALETLNGELTPTVDFNQTSLVVLWNAGCSGCLPAIADVSKAAMALGVTTYGIAVMVQNIQMTREIAKHTPTDAILSLEKLDDGQKGLNRGQVTRNWLEASGQNAVPASFVIDQHGRIAFIGPLDDGVLGVLRKVVDGKWDIDRARQQWAHLVSDEDVSRLVIRREITDAMLGNNLKGAQTLLNKAEHVQPELANDKDFALEKLIVLSSSPEMIDAAIRHYEKCVASFAMDQISIIRFTDILLGKEIPIGRIANSISKALGQVEKQLCNTENNIILPLRFHLTKARFCIRTADESGFERHIKALRKLAVDETTPKALREMIDKEIEQLSSNPGFAPKT